MKTNYRSHPLCAFIGLALILTLGPAGADSPTGGSWTTTGSLADGRLRFTLTSLPDGRVLAVGGDTPLATASAELYDPATSAWTPADSLESGARITRRRCCLTGRSSWPAVATISVAS